MKIQCGCKVNLYLRITGKRENGYHDLDTLFYPLSVPYDVLDIEETGEGSRENDSVCISVDCTTEGIDLEDNTLTKAYALYSKETGFSPKIHVTLEKGIPHGAGLGGGSSDAAALLCYLQEKNPQPLTQEKLFTLSAKIGADVPFFLINSPCKATGIGDILEPVTLSLENLYLVLINPYIQISTKWAFLRRDEAKKDLTEIAAFDKNHRSCFLKEFFWENDFEIPVFLEYPFLGEIKKELILSSFFVYK